MKRSAGLLLELGGGLHFLSAEVARSIVHRPVVARVPGTDLGLALVEGRVLPVFELGPARSGAVVCELPGVPEPESIALSGAEVLEVGEYPATPGGVLFEGRTVPLLDVERMVGRARRGLVAPAEGVKS